jgi:hypothetical protein
MNLLTAEILKLRKRRGLMVTSLLLTVGSVFVAYGVMLGLHVADPSHHGPAGGAENLRHLMLLLANVGGVAAVLVGTTAGSQDASAGVFRDLAVTGRPRRALFRIRTPGALAVYVPMLATGLALAIAGSYALAGGEPTPSLHVAVHDALAVAALGVVTLAVAVGLAPLVPARIATGVLVGWNSFVAPLLAGIASLGALRAGIDVAAAMHFAPDLASERSLPVMSTSTAVIALLLWVGISQRVGELWTRRADA